MHRLIDCPISVNFFLQRLVTELKITLPKDLIGIYATGSLSYGGFELRKSDIDVAVLVRRPLAAKQIQLLQKLHEEILAKVDPIWNEALECSYIPVGYFCHVTPPKSPRPYSNNGHFYPAAHYGHEWATNYALLYEYGIPLYGPDLREQINPIPMEAVQQACINGMRQDWAPLLKSPDCLRDPSYQAYIPLTLCRSLYTLAHGKLATKKEAAAWAKRQLEPRWGQLISAALKWKAGQPLSLQSEVRQFIRFCLKEVEQYDTTQLRSNFLKALGLCASSSKSTPSPNARKAVGGGAGA